MLRIRFREKELKIKTDFDQLMELLKELLHYTAGDLGEALAWMTELDKREGLTSEDYGIADFINDLEKLGYLNRESPGLGPEPTGKLEIELRRHALKYVFGNIRKGKSGKHNTSRTGHGDDSTLESRPFEFGDKVDRLSVSESLYNAQLNHGLDDFRLTEKDLVVHDTYAQSNVSTALLIDLSHSMILYGEDRITPARKVALALSEWITTQYPKDTLDIVAFGDEAWPVQLADLPYLKVGPYHTNTAAALELAIKLLQKRRNPNKQIFMITDGKPSVVNIGKKIYKNSFGLDPKILQRTYAKAAKCRKLDIPVTTFMIAKDPYLMQFVDEFTAINGGKAIYSSLDQLGEYIFLDYKRSRKNKKR